MSGFARLEAHAWFRRDPDEWVREMVDLHFHPSDGAPYWIRRAAELGIDAPREIRSARDLVKLGPMDEEALRALPGADFLPRQGREAGDDLLFVESSGTTGPPKTAGYTVRDFMGAFVASFRPVAEPLGFPRGGPWLFVGPTGPHAIGRAARELPRVMGCPEPFMVDFDPRWARKLAEGSVARTRYLAHLVGQAAEILRREEVTTLFATPPTLTGLAEKVEEPVRHRVRGIHFGGMEVTAELRHALRAAFPRAAFLSGYGNSLFGVALEMGGEDGRNLDYFTAGPRHLIRVVREDGPLGEDAAYGETGRILMSRLDPSGFYANVMERDEGTRIPPSEAAKRLGFLLDGVRDPHPLRTAPSPKTGFY